MACWRPGGEGLGGIGNEDGNSAFLCRLGGGKVEVGGEAKAGSGVLAGVEAAAGVEVEGMGSKARA